VIISLLKRVRLLPAKIDSWSSYENAQYAPFDTFFEGIFQKERLLDIIKNFICFSNEDVNNFKILAGYHQYFAVNKAVASTKKAAAEGGDGKVGVFWHTQGSGKSLSMVFCAHLLQEALDSPTLVVLTDRNDLEDQLYGQFAKCKEFLRQEPMHAENREHLKTPLAGCKANGIIDKAILDANGVICDNIKQFSVSDHGLLSQNILGHVRNFVEYVAIKAYSNGEDVKK